MVLIVKGRKDGKQQQHLQDFDENLSEYMKTNPENNNHWNKVQQKYNLVTEDEIDRGCWWSTHKVKIKLPEGWKWKYKKPLLVLETEQGKVIFSQYYDIQLIR
mgnify:CR=1 FL=1